MKCVIVIINLKNSNFKAIFFIFYVLVLQVGK